MVKKAEERGLQEISQKLEDLSQRIAAEKSEQDAENQPQKAYQGVSAYSKAYRLMSEFVAGVFVGGLIGYGLDKLIGSTPLFMIIFLFLGFGAGLLNMARAAKKLPQAQQRLKATPPAKVDDEEDEDA